MTNCHLIQLGVFCCCWNMQSFDFFSKLDIVRSKLTILYYTGTHHRLGANWLDTLESPLLVPNCCTHSRTGSPPQGSERPDQAGFQRYGWFASTKKQNICIVWLLYNLVSALAYISAVFIPITKKYGTSY